MRIEDGWLDTPEAVEGLRRSIAMLPPQAPVWDREEACEVLTRLGEALRASPQRRNH